MFKLLEVSRQYKELFHLAYVEMLFHFSWIDYIKCRHNAFLNMFRTLVEIP
ncbi:unnamed protein product [Moneuplotes crassus]|uniref:Uncharacterized protein n=1 Tax=Euplotes crassus TaxID=5936 RepID=A0AAD1XLA5_EUPCR|nr:unnamed protein product [Moneuplotes crassus]